MTKLPKKLERKYLNLDYRARTRERAMAVAWVVAFVAVFTGLTTLTAIALVVFASAYVGVVWVLSLCSVVSLLVCDAVAFYLMIAAIFVLIKGWDEIGREHLDPEITIRPWFDRGGAQR